MIASDQYLIEVIDEALDFNRLYSFATAAECGAVNTFIGTVRNHFEERHVSGMQYSGYPEMAEKQLELIVQSALEKWPLHKVAVQHRLGTLTLQERSVIIVVSAAHRAASFDGCRFIIEEIKKDVPIWKKEFFVDGGAEWKDVSK